MLKMFITILIPITCFTATSLAGNKNENNGDNYTNQYNEKLTFQDTTEVLKDFIGTSPNQSVVRYNGKTEDSKDCTVEFNLYKSATMSIFIVDHVGQIINKANDLNDYKNTRLYVSSKSLTFSQDVLEKQYVIFGKLQLLRKSLRIRKNIYQLIFTFSTRKGDSLNTESCFVNL